MTVSSSSSTPLSLRQQERITFGRDPSNDQVIDHPLVAKFHAQITQQAGNWVLTDLESSDGTFVNEQSIQTPHTLRPGDVIRIGATEFTFHFEEILTQNNEAGHLRVDALNLTRKGLRNQVLLDQVSLSILPREFVAIVGVSGAGKTTLLDALSGFHPAQEGTVLVNGHDLYQHYGMFRTELGYVPQDDIIHRELTIYQALDFSARLRLPRDVSAKERDRRIQDVLANLELTHRQHALVRQLSGGQRKRVSIGVELLTQPSLFFLDEATSGLDPGTETQMMRLLRRLADQGRTVILVTHATKNVMCCDKVVFLAKGGKLAFYGSPQEALAYFQVEDFDDIYLRVEEERSPQEWQEAYLESSAYQAYVSDRQSDIKDRPKSSKRALRNAPWFSKRSSSWRQFLLLSQRNLTILWQDRTSLLIMLTLAPLLGLLDFVVMRRDVFDTTVGDSGQAITVAFVSVLISVLMGCLVMVREIVKEAEIYRRERMIGLKLMPYILSKVCLSAVLALYQSAMFLLVKTFAIDFPGDYHTLLGIYVTLFLCTLGGMIMGLLVSAIAPSQNAAPLLAILFLVPQITLAGSIFPLYALGSVGQTMSQFMLTRWGHETMVTLTEIGKDVANDPCWQQPESVRKGWSEAEKAKCRCLGPHLYERCTFPGLAKEYDAAVKQSEPKRPKDLADPPEVPENLLSADASGFRDELSNYREQVKQYRTDMDRWRDRYTRWKEKRGKAIASGEALLGRVRKSQGQSFAVNVYGHWSKLGLLQIGMLGLLMGIQKQKDTLK